MTKLSIMKRRLRRTDKGWIPMFAGGVLVGLIGLMFVSIAEGQDPNPATSSRTDPSPEAVVQFYESFLTLYMENYRRIDRLRTMRSAGVGEEASSLASEIRRKTEEAIADGRANLRSVSPDEVRSRVLDSMKKLLTIYPIYIEKIVTNWEPNKQQVLMRRRLNENQIMDRNPELASPSLLRRVFLGELVTSAHFIPETRGWFQNRIRNVRNWISSKKKELYPLFVRLVSRVEQIMLDENAEAAEKEQVIEDAHTEWQAFWQDVGKGSDWQGVRYTINQLSSFFRNRTDRLPGYQSVYREKVNRLQKQIGSLQKLQIDEPFATKKKRLETMLLLCKMLAEQVNDLTGQQSNEAIDSVVAFVTDQLNRDPSAIWKGENNPELEQKKQQVLTKTSLASGDVGSLNLEGVREAYRFPTEALVELSNRLTNQFGEKGKELGAAVRVLVEDVRNKQVLLTEGVKVLKQYNNALQEQEATEPDDLVQFEQTFRSEHQSMLQNIKQRVRQVQERRQNVTDQIERLSGISPRKLADTFQTAQNRERSE